jgi:hypothetical protein
MVLLARRCYDGGMITDNMPAASVGVSETADAPAGQSFLTARSLVTPVPAAKWMSQWQPDEEIWKVAAKVAASS